MVNVSHPSAQHTPLGYRSPSIRLDPGARARRRSECWRDGCRDRFGEYATVAFLDDGRIVAWCHRRIHDDLSYRVDLWRHEMAA